MAKNNYVFLKSDKARKALGNVTGSKLPIIKIAYDYLSIFSRADILSNHFDHVTKYFRSNILNK